MGQSGWECAHLYKGYFRENIAEEVTFDSRSERQKETNCMKMSIVGEGTNSTMVLRYGLLEGQ